MYEYGKRWVSVQIWAKEDSMYRESIALAFSYGTGHVLYRYHLGIWNKTHLQSVLYKDLHDASRPSSSNCYWRCLLAALNG